MKTPGLLSVDGSFSLDSIPVKLTNSFFLLCDVSLVLQPDFGLYDSLMLATLTLRGMNISCDKCCGHYGLYTLHLH